MLECTTAAEVVENYKAVRSRVNKWKPVPEPMPEAKPEPTIQKIEIVEMAQNTTVSVHHQEAEPPVHRQHPSIHRIVVAVCDKYKVRQSDLVSERRTANIVRPRQIVMYLAKQLTLRSYPDIGRVLNRDHTSCLHGVKKIAALRAVFKDLDAELTEFEILLGGTNV